MNQLAREWEEEFETLCTLLAHSVVVYADETSWSFNSVWAFLSDDVRLLLFGVPKDGQTLKAILDRATFDGILVSDDAAVYRNFTKAQKCWAHLLRKAIKLTLLAPENRKYRTFADGLLALYRQACRIPNDRRYQPAGRQRKVVQLGLELTELCETRWLDETLPSDDVEDSYRLLVNELMRLLLAEELLTFVCEPAVAGTNNCSERILRGPAQARKTGRTNKTIPGARRQSILQSVLESLRCQLPRYGLDNVVEEVTRWFRIGRSCFRELAEAWGQDSSESSVLDTVLPLPG